MQFLLAALLRGGKNCSSDWAAYRDRIGNPDAIEDGVRSLRELDGRSDRGGVLVRYAVCEQDECLPSSLPGGDVLCRVPDGAVDEGGMLFGNRQPSQGVRKLG